MRTASKEAEKQRQKQKPKQKTKFFIAVSFCNLCKIEV
jgi:hypothetical protein